MRQRAMNSWGMDQGYFGLGVYFWSVHKFIIFFSYSEDYETVSGNLVEDEESEVEEEEDISAYFIEAKLKVNNHKLKI